MNLETQAIAIDITKHHSCGREITKEHIPLGQGTSLIVDYCPECHFYILGNLESKNPEKIADYVKHIARLKQQI